MSKIVTNSIEGLNDADKITVSKTLNMAFFFSTGGWKILSI